MHIPTSGTNRTFRKKVALGVLGMAMFLAGSSPAAALTVTGALGRSVSLPAPVDRLVVLNENALEILRMLGALDRVKAVSDYIARRTDYWPELAGLPTVGGWQDPNFEAIAAARPQLVLCYGRNPGLALERMLMPLGIQVLRQDFYRLSTLTREVSDLAAVLGDRAAAETFIEWHRQILDRVSAALGAAEAPLPAVYLESFSDYRAWGPDSGVSDMCRLAGGRLVTADMAMQSALVTPEWVLSRNPDVIIKTPHLPRSFSSDARPAMAGIRERILTRPGWESITAIRQKRVFILNSEVCSSPAAAAGIAFMARWFHPGAFKDLHPEKLHREYVTRFQKIVYRGYYAYPR